MRELEELVAADTAALRAWLLERHETSPGGWLALHKLGGTVTAVTWQLAVDEGLCFGWIDVLTRTNRDALIHRLGAVKKQETRVRKIEQFVELLARHEAPYPQQAKPAETASWPSTRKDRQPDIGFSSSGPTPTRTERTRAATTAVSCRHQVTADHHAPRDR